MPSTMKMFVRNSKLTELEWLAIVENRRRLIKPHLDRFSLIELGQFVFLHAGDPVGHAMNPDRPNVKSDDGKYSLKTQGIFVAREFYRYAPLKSDEVIPFWGLTRAAEWIVVRVESIDTGGYKGRGYQKATGVNICRADLPTMLSATNETPERIWAALGKVVQEWTSQREKQFQEAQVLLRTIEIEHETLSHLPQ